MSQSMAQVYGKECLGWFWERRGFSLRAHLQEPISDALLRANAAVSFLTIELYNVTMRPVSILRLWLASSNVCKHIALREIVKIFER